MSPFPQLPHNTSNSPTTRRSDLKRQHPNLLSKICLTTSSLAAWNSSQARVGDCGAQFARSHSFLKTRLRSRLLRRALSSPGWSTFIRAPSESSYNWGGDDLNIKISTKISLICNAVSFNSWIYVLLHIIFCVTGHESVLKSFPRSLRVVFLASSRCFSSSPSWFFRQIWSCSVWFADFPWFTLIRQLKTKQVLLAQPAAHEPTQILRGCFKTCTSCTKSHRVRFST